MAISFVKKIYGKIHSRLDLRNVQEIIATRRVFTAYELKNYDKMITLLEKYSASSYQNLKADDLTILHHAILEQNIEAIQALTELNYFSSIINEKNNEDAWTPVLRATSLRNLYLIKFLHLKGADLTLPKKDGMTILHIAACENCVKSADYIIQNSLAPIIDAQTEDGWTPAHMAAFMGHFDFLNLLIQNGADISKENKHGMNCLHEAIRIDNLDMLEILYPLLKESDIARDRTKPRTFGLIHLAASSEAGNQCLQYLLKQNVFINEPCNDVEKGTALHFSILGKRNENLRLLLRNGANVNAEDKLGNTGYHLAVGTNNIEAVKIIEEYQGNALKENKDKLCALDYAMSENLKEIIGFLKSKQKYESYDFQNIR